MNYKVFDNFLPKDYFDNLKNLIFDKGFPWHYKDFSAYEDGDDGPTFTHFLYQLEKPTSNLFEKFVPFLEHLKVKHLIQLRVNMVTKDRDYSVSDFHIDYDNLKDSTTGIFYLNTNNGYTLLGENEKIRIESIENRLLLFPVYIRHAAGRQTNTNRRVLININYL